MSSFSAFSAAARRLEGKVALITGGASGIGEYTAKFFTKHGAKVMIADIQDDLSQSICENLGQSNASYIHCDVTKEAHVQNAVDKTVNQYGTLDVMCNNAGIAGSSDPNILNITQSNLVIKVNLIGSFLGTKHAARVMDPTQQGSIITTASTCSVIGGVGPHAYTSSKHGVLGLTRNTAVELGKYGIR
ncbi:Secoisolariciresinol dehydrogenase, partial [Bienertia sinuspersici]